MFDDALAKLNRGRSPFDAIRHVNDDGVEWWSMREMIEPLGYTRYDYLIPALNRAKNACRNRGKDPADHFLHSQEMVDIGSGARRAKADVQMSRLGCYFLAMNGEPSKPEIAAAQAYFADMTRLAELEVGAQVVINQPSAPPTGLAWSVRFRQSTQAHFCYMTTHHLGYFSVVSAAVAQMLMIEEEIYRHLLPLNPGDLPDGSIGQRWSTYRASRGLPEPTMKAPLLLPSRSFEAKVSIYPVAELGDFLAWLMTVYIPEHLPTYFSTKVSFKPFGQLPPVSAADNACKGLTGKPAKLAPKIRKQLDSVKGFFPVGAALPPPNQGQLPLFDQFS